MNYYSLVAGLPDIQLEDFKSVPSILQLKRELLEQLSTEDVKLLKIIFAKIDNHNWLKYLADKEAVLNPLGNIGSDDFPQLLTLMQEVDNLNDDRLLPYIQSYYLSSNEEKFLSKGINNEDYLTSLYYDYAAKIRNDFLKDWFEFNLNVNNVLIAVTSRKHDWDVKAFIVGNNEVAQTIRSSNSRDFGLTGIFDQLDTVLRIADEPNLISREKQIDALKWQWLDEHTFFNYFGVEKVLAFVLKVEMIERWKPLTMEKGTDIFRELLGNLKEGVNFDETID